MKFIFSEKVGIRPSFHMLNEDMAKFGHLLGLTIDFVNIGREPNDGKGDSFNVAFGKVHSNLERILAEIQK